VICPTCQKVFFGSSIHASAPLFSRGCFLCMGLFSIFLLAEPYLARRIARLVAIERAEADLTLSD
jgi:hypothetical protein